MKKQELGNWNWGTGIGELELENWNWRTGIGELELGNWNWGTHNSVLGTEVKLDKLDKLEAKTKSIYENNMVKSILIIVSLNRRCLLLISTGVRQKDCN